MIIARSAEREFRGLDACRRSALKRVMHDHLELEPTRESKSRIKRLRSLRRPQYRLRVDDMRVFYDVNPALRRVEVLGFVRKASVEAWLERHGVPE
ncbi:type II toxin-antitoxin system RelE/ParE family toxin [Candidatus Fermentibacteria bacterium]|nr:type II toxin-antitoxin system RelE/ParE family toxin [Candidatus Fermentibacteria bacterium]